MKRVVVMLLITCCALTVQAQKINYKDFKKATITDPGQLYSTYKYETEELSIIRKVVSSEDLLNTVVQYSNESTWPSEISTLESRQNNQELIKGLKAWQLADIGNDHIVLIIPAKQNKKKPLKLKTDIFMVFGKSGLK